MPKQNKVFSLFYTDTVSKHYWLKIVSFAFTFSLLLFYCLHISIILTNKSILDDYARDVFFKSRVLDFQIKHSFSLSEAKESTFCSEKDFALLRDILNKYYYLGDLGRVVDNKILCSVKKGILDKPFSLINEPDAVKKGVSYWNKQSKLVDTKKVPQFTKQNTITSISPAFLEDLNSSVASSNGAGGYLYLKDSDYIFRIYGKINTEHVLQARNLKASIYDFLFLPGSILREDLCDNDSDICLMTVVQAAGLFNLPYLHLLVYSIAIFTFSLFITLTTYSLQGGSKAFLRRLRKAIKSDDISPVYQPKILINSGKIIGVESLARWKDPVLGHISPDLFISVAEQANLIQPLTKNFIQKTFHDLKTVLEKNTEFTLSINLSSDVLINRHFLPFLKNEVSKYNFNNDQIIFEITERTSSNSAEMAEAASSIKKLGFLVSLDDFGTGYSNFAWLTTFEPDEIKIDKMFTQAIETQTVNRITLDGMFTMLDHLKVKVVFEGIETENQKSYIQQRVPCAIGQGWYYSKPKSINDLLFHLHQKAIVT